MRQLRVLLEAAIKLHRIGIDQQLGGIEPQAAFGIVRSVRAIAVARADKIVGNLGKPDFALLRHGQAGFARASEQAQINRLSQRRAHGKTGHAACHLRAERLGHVTTSGAVRPVCAAIPAMASAAAIRSASMAGVSSAKRPSGPS